MYATVAGVVERVNRLISVKALKARYAGSIGDVVIGRISDVGPKRWKVECNAKQDAFLMLSSITLPGGVQVGYLGLLEEDGEIDLCIATEARGGRTGHASISK